MKKILESGTETEKNMYRFNLEKVAREDYDVIYTDGFTLGHNPSKRGGGFLLCDSNGREIEKQTFYKSYYTNNEAELMGALEAAKRIAEFGTIYTDSNNTILWVKYCNCKARPDLRPFAEETRDLLREKKAKLVWVKRGDNMAGRILEGM